MEKALKILKDFMGFGFDLEMTEKLEEIVKNGNNDFTNFLNNDFNEITNNCKATDICLNFDQDKINSIKLQFSITNFGGMEANFRWENLYFEFDINGKLLRGYTYSCDSDWMIEIENFDSINVKFLNYMASKYNIAFELTYCGFNEKVEEEYENKNYDDFSIAIEMNTEDGCTSRYKDITKLYNDFISGNLKGKLQSIDSLSGTIKL